MREGSHNGRSMCLASRMAPQSWKLGIRCLVLSFLGSYRLLCQETPDLHIVLQGQVLSREEVFFVLSRPGQVSLTAGGAALSENLPIHPSAA